MTEQQAATAYVEHHEDEGHSKLGWICVALIILGFLVGAVAFFLADALFVWVGVGITLLGAVLWPVLKLVGLGPKDQDH